jgi:antitoxin component YwqK of YwqJK toxin-antitoxin module
MAAWLSLRQQDAKVPVVIRKLTQGELILREGKLYADSEAIPFDGILFENFSGGIPKLEIEIVYGKADGRSVGFFDNGQLEVEEFFVKGVSHGVRTRWNQQGVKISEEQIEGGQVNGLHVKWHDNGNKALQMILLDGQPDGLAEAWHPNGSLKSRAQFVSGKMVSREFFAVTASTTDSDSVQSTGAP